MITKMNHNYFTLRTIVLFSLLIFFIGCNRDNSLPNKTNSDCYSESTAEIPATGNIGNYYWYTDVQNGFWYKHAIAIRSRPNCDSLIISFLGYAKRSDLTYPLYIDFHLVLRNHPLKKFEELVTLNNTNIVLNDSSNYILFVDDHYHHIADSANSDTIRVSSGIVNFTKVHNLCGITWGYLLADRMFGTFNFSIPNGSKKLSAVGNFDFYLRPGDDNIHFGN